MAANPTIEVETRSGLESYHVYHAEAHVLSGELKHPVKQPIEFEGHVILANTRREGHLTRSTASSTLEGLISFRAAYTRASGNKVKKTDAWGNEHSGWVTLSTSIIEGLNVFEVITADRVVAQVSTEHPENDGHVPKVTFLGTRFENLRVGGYPVRLKFNYGICGNKPAGDRPYIEDGDFLARVEEQLANIANAKGLPIQLHDTYQHKVAELTKLRSSESIHRPNLNCSLVTSVDPIPELGIQTFGNLMVIPEFGTVALADLEVGMEPPSDSFMDKHHHTLPSSNGDSGHDESSNYFRLHMLDMHLGCIGGGTVTAATAKTNGMTRP
jgi:hypothetical protein